MRTEAIVFDFFGVISNEIAPLWLQAHFSPEAARHIKANVVGAADRGELSDKAMFDVLSRLAGTPAYEIKREWHSMVGLDRRVLEFVRGCRRSHKVALLTNAPREFFRDIEREHGLVGVFDAVIVSSEIGYAKPSLKAFEHALNALGVASGAAVMIDDNPENVSAAQSMGMVGVLFRSYDDLQRRKSVIMGGSDTSASASSQ